MAFLLTSLVAGGEERIASVLAKAIAQNEDLHIVLFNLPIEFELPQNISLKILRPIYRNRLVRILTLPLLLWRYHRYCQKENIEHSISFDNLPNFINCGLKLLRWKGKVYLREVNHVSTRYSATTLYGRTFRWLIKKLYPFANQIFMNAQRIATDLKENYGLTVPMTISPNPIDIDLIGRSAKGEGQRVNAILQPSTPNPFTFLHVGAFRPQKNHALLIAAFAKIKHLPVKLWFIGKGDLMPRIQQQVEDLDLAEQVHFWGFQSNPFQYMVAANCMVMSSHFEGLPNVFLEALACGLPIISTDCPTGPREIIAPDTDQNLKVTNDIELAEYGILTPVGNSDKLAEAMEYVYQNDRYRKGDFYKKRVEPFRVDRVVGELMEILDAEC